MLLAGAPSINFRLVATKLLTSFSDVVVSILRLLITTTLLNFLHDFFDFSQYLLFLL